MSDRTSSMGTKTRLAGLLFQDRLTGTDEEIALSHETNRQSAVKEILVHIFLMAKFRFFPGALIIRKAENQYLVAHDDDQAAHCAPGQMESGSQTVQTLITKSDDLQLLLENLFAKTDEMHGRFNKADSRAEQEGLRAAFGNACNQVAEQGRTARFGRAYQFYPYIDAAFNLYKTQGLLAFTAAIAKQRAKMQAGTPLKGTTTRAELIFILETYRAQLATARDTLETVQGLDPEDLWREYGRFRP